MTNALHQTGGRLRLTAAIVVATLLALSGAEPAHATTFRYQVINVTKGRAHAVGPKVFASCKVWTTGGICQISKGRSASRDIALSLGVSRGTVAAALNVASGSSVSVNVSCQSPPLKAGQTWKAKAMGRYYHYNVRKQLGAQGRTGVRGWSTIATSPRLTAFNPAASEVACGL